MLCCINTFIKVCYIFIGVKKPWKGCSMAEMEIHKKYNNRLLYKGWKEKYDCHWIGGITAYTSIEQMKRLAGVPEWRTRESAGIMQQSIRNYKMLLPNYNSGYEFGPLRSHVHFGPETIVLSIQTPLPGL